MELLLAFPGERLFRECSLRFLVEGCRAQLRRGLALRNDLSVEQDLYPQTLYWKSRGRYPWSSARRPDSLDLPPGSGMVRWRYEVSGLLTEAGVLALLRILLRAATAR